MASLETYTKPKELVGNPYFKAQKQKNLDSLSNNMIDEPIVEIVNSFNKLSYCFTLQSCCGHFLYNGQKDPHNYDSLPVTNTITRVEYKIAYIALCIEDSNLGSKFFEALKEITVIDPENIQFCCAEWFWERQVNSYVLQVEPDRFKNKDTAILNFKEALHIEKIRNEFFIRLYELLEMQRKTEIG